jgi:secreted PhoX family phosphatase
MPGVNQTRRSFLRSGAVAAGALALGPPFWRGFLCAPARLGPGPYGPLRVPDTNGFRLPEGFSSRVIARGNQPVPGTTDVFHIFPDGAATYATGDRGWILVSNSENPPPTELGGRPAFGMAGGGAGALRFRPDGSVADYYRILGGTSTNCAGGATPWGTWMSCEEVDDGLVWECDPTGREPAKSHPAMGVFKHEAVAVDGFGRRIYLSEDQDDGGLYRFTPDRWPDCSSGLLELAIVAHDGRVRWVRVPDPSGQVGPTRHQIAEVTKFRRGEGLWLDSGVVYLATTSDSKIHAYDTASETIDVLYDAVAIPDPPLTGVDNVTASRSGDLFVCEDNGEDTLDIGIITPEREVARFLTLGGTEHSESELTGAVFDPSGSRLYFASQRAAGPGALYEVTGPFR